MKVHKLQLPALKCKSPMVAMVAVPFLLVTIFSQNSCSDFTLLDVV